MERTRSWTTTLHGLRSYPRSDMSMSSRTDTKPREFRHLRPLPCVGVYEPEDDISVSSVFLGPEKMTIRERDDEKMIAKGLVPIPIRDDIETGLIAAMKTDDRDTVYKTWNSASITDRDGGFFDNLSPILKKLASKPTARKDMFEALRLRGSSISPYHGVISALDTHADLKITGLLLEVADRPSPYSLSLGAAIMVAKTDCASKWKLSQSRIKLVKESRASSEARLVNCAMDELVGFALASKLPVVISENLYSTVSVDGLMEKRNEVNSTGVTALPRPREGVQAVDALLIPLLDEEVAYEILRRLAETKGDFQEAAEMDDFQSRKPVIA
eukprot:gene9887-20573_t